MITNIKGKEQDKMRRDNVGNGCCMCMCRMLFSKAADVPGVYGNLVMRP